VITAFVPMVVAWVMLRVRPRAVTRVSDAITEHPLVSGSLGLLAGLVGLVLAVFMVFTIVLIPVALLVLLAIALVALMGWVGLGFALGRWIGIRRGWTRPAPRMGLLGTALLAVLMHLIELVPVVGAIVPLLALVVGFGAVWLTRFGSRRFEAQSYDPVEPDRVATT
jgi:hypothetical protein